MTLGKSTRAHALMDHLRQQIVESKIAPGEKLPSENELVAEHGVSRTVVREALLRLQSGGYIHTRRGAGSYALVPPSEGAHESNFPVARTLQDRVHLLAFRAAVESEAAASCANRASEVHLLEMAQAIDDFESAANTPTLAMQYDFAFHLAIANASGNPFFVHAIRSLGPAMIAMPAGRLTSQTCRGGIGALEADHVAVEHRRILAAIQENDVLGAATAMRSHLLNSRYRLVDDGE